MLVRAKPQPKPSSIVKATIEEQPQSSEEKNDNDTIVKQLVDHQDETILLDKVKYVEEGDNTHFELSILQQTCYHHQNYNWNNINIAICFIDT